MTGIEIHAGGARQGARLDSGAVAVGLTKGLYLAATPTFAIMAMLTYASGGDADMICSAGHGVSLLSGMVPMYLLMSAFHLAPWLKLVFRRGSAPRG